MAVACQNYLEPRIPTSEIGWFPRGNPVRSPAPFAPDAPGQSACAGQGSGRWAWHDQFLLPGPCGKGLGENAELQPEQEQAALCLFAHAGRGGRKIKADDGVPEAQSGGI